MFEEYHVIMIGLLLLSC